MSKANLKPYGKWPPEPSELPEYVRRELARTLAPAAVEAVKQLVQEGRIRVEVWDEEGKRWVKFVEPVEPKPVEGAEAGK
jgi:hypothetical protein